MNIRERSPWERRQPVSPTTWSMPAGIRSRSSPRPRSRHSDSALPTSSAVGGHLRLSSRQSRVLMWSSLVTGWLFFLPSAFGPMAGVRGLAFGGGPHRCCVRGDDPGDRAHTRQDVAWGLAGQDCGQQGRHAAVHVQRTEAPPGFGVGGAHTELGPVVRGGGRDLPGDGLTEALGDGVVLLDCDLSGDVESGHFGGKLPRPLLSVAQLVGTGVGR